MRKQLLLVLLAILLIGFISLGVRNIRSTNQKLQFHEIELKSKETQLTELNLKYDEVIQLQTKTEQEKQEKLEKIKQLETDRERLERELRVKLDRNKAEQEKLATAAKKATATPKASATPVTGDKQAWISAAGISDYSNANIIVSKESTWQVGVVNGIGCVGLIQACPAGLKPRMVAACPNWSSDPVCQLRIAESYMQARYGSWANAVAFHRNNNWW